MRFSERKRKDARKEEASVKLKRMAMKVMLTKKTVTTATRLKVVLPPIVPSLRSNRRKTPSKR